MSKLFGTDGIRGTPGEYPLTDVLLFKLGKAAAHLLEHKKGLSSKGTAPAEAKIIIGKDTRASGEKIEKILINAITSCGVDVILSGVIPTPGLAFLTKKLKADLGIMISASHNKATENGIKFFDQHGFKLPVTQENKIEDLVLKYHFDDAPAYNRGVVTEVKESDRLYIDFLKSKAKGLNLKGRKIVLDCAYGASSSVAPQLFAELGAEVYAIHDQPNGLNINLDSGALHPHKVAQMVKQYKADIGFSFDGDADRVILSDEKAKVLDGDFVMAIIGLHLLKKNKLPQSTIVTTVMSNFGLEQALTKAGGKLIRTDVGDRNVTETLVKNKLFMGGEQSGHIVFSDHSTTGDALITTLEVLKVMQESGKTLSELSKCMRKYPQVLINVRVKEKRPLKELVGFQKAVKRCESRLKGQGRLLVRYSGTELLARIMVEGINKDLIEDIASSLAKEIHKELGSD